MTTHAKGNEMPHEDQACKHGTAKNGKPYADCAQCDAEQGKAVDNMITALLAIQEKHSEPGKRFKRPAQSISATMSCPICTQPLHYSIASSNGHIWARCETAECINFIQ